MAHPILVSYTVAFLSAKPLLFPKFATAAVRSVDTGDGDAQLQILDKCLQRLPLGRTDRPGQLQANKIGLCVWLLSSG